MFLETVCINEISNNVKSALFVKSQFRNFFEFPNYRIVCASFSIKFREKSFLKARHLLYIPHLVILDPGVLPYIIFYKLYLQDDKKAKNLQIFHYKT